jgi:DNA-binding CsgD family transcriptional regulator
MPEEQRLYAAALSRIAAAEAELAEVRDVVAALAVGPPQQPRSWPPDLAEVLYGRAEQEHRIDQLQREARKEVLTFVRPPYVMQGNPVQEERLAAGIVYRSLYESSALTHPGSAELPGFVPPGEHARATPRVPLKLMIVDNEHALLPLISGHSDFTSGGLLLLHQSVILDALIELFEERWLRGTPLRFSTEAPDPEIDLPVSPALDAQLLSLLMSGLPDKAIANQLGISLRTLQRRIRGLMESTGTANRMQLAWYLAQQRLA